MQVDDQIVAARAELQDRSELSAIVDQDFVDVRPALEGLAGWLPDLAPHWSTEEGRAVILFAAEAVEAEPSLLGLSAHLLIVTSVPQ